MLNSDYLQIDEKLNALDSLSRTRLFLGNVSKDPLSWKWVMIALHNSLYGAMILALQGSSPEKRVAVQTKKLLSADYDTPRLIGFPEVWKRVCNPDYMGLYLNSRFVCVLPADDQVQELSNDPVKSKKAAFFGPRLLVSVDHLNKYIRNQFMHYYPVSISYGLTGFMQIISDVPPVIRFLLLECGNVRLDADEEAIIIDDELSTINELLGRLR